MSVNYYDKQTGKIYEVAGSSRVWIGSKAAHDAEVLADKMPYNVLVAILETGLFYRDANGNEQPVSMSNNIIANYYDNTSTYKVNDFVIYDNTLYKCITAVDTAEDFDGEKWVATTITDEIKSLLT